ncbi:MAG TPA: RNA methyltransferase [Acidimicrobiales bacterium]|nr:RNA methyltransferase [Acidimicrobiales bacterium]
MKLLAGALAAGAEVESVFVEPGARAQPAVDGVVRAAADRGARVFDLGPGVLERVADTITPQPVLAVVAMPRATLDQLSGATFVVVCVDVRDPGNAGAIVRVADAAGADAVVCCDGTVDAFNPKTVRASAGSVLHLPVVPAGDAPSTLEALGAAGLSRVAAVASGGVPYTDLEPPTRLALVLGNESGGVPHAALDHVDTRVTIPMAGGVESLNVSTAAAVLCFDVARRRSNLHAMEPAP